MVLIPPKAAGCGCHVVQVSLYGGTYSYASVGSINRSRYRRIPSLELPFLEQPVRTFRLPKSTKLRPAASALITSLPGGVRAASIFEKRTVTLTRRMALHGRFEPVAVVRFGSIE